MAAEPQLVPVESSVFTGHTYQPATKQLILQFKNKELWAYANVGPKLYASLQKAKSLGVWFSKNIRANSKKHPGNRLS